MKFLISVPASLKRCQDVQRLFLRALRGGGFASTSSSASLTSADARVFVCSDPPAQPLGSGGGTVHLLHQCFHAELACGQDSQRPSLTPSSPPTLLEPWADMTEEGAFWSWLSRERRVLLHAGGQSRRLPSYAATGKLLTPLPCFLPITGKEAHAGRGDAVSPTSDVLSVGHHTPQCAAHATPPLPIPPCSYLCPPPPRAGVACPSRRLDETVLSRQADFIARVLPTTPAHLRTVILCGDICLTTPLGSLPSVTARRPAVPPCRDASAQVNTVDEPVTGGEEVIDVLCYGVGAEADRLSRHGVFVVDPRHGHSLRCMLQKPTELEMRRAAVRDSDMAASPPYQLLLDIGVWMLSDRAVRCLYQQYCSGHQPPTTDSTESPHGRAYDLFSDFGGCLGEAPQRAACRGAPGDVTPSSLRVQVVDLTDTGLTFLHLGTTADLVDSTVALAAATTAPREGPVFHPLFLPSSATAVKSGPPPPAPLRHYVDTARRVFVQDAHVAALAATALTTKQTANCIWIDCADVGADVALQHHHVLTGFPPGNDWVLHLPAFACVSVVPMCASAVRADDALSCGPLWAARIYGYADTFTGDVRDEATQFMSTSLHAWLNARTLTLEDIAPLDALGTTHAHDIYAARLFPCSPSLGTLGRLIQFLVAPPSRHDPEALQSLAALWRRCPRVSAADISAWTDVARMEALRDDFLRDALPQWLAFEPTTRVPCVPAAYDLLDLHATAARWAELRLPVPQVPDTPTLYTARASMFCARVLELAPSSAINSSAAQWDDHAFAVLRTCITSASPPVAPGCELPLPRGLLPTNKAPWRLPRAAVQADQVVWARSPARIDLSGGWTDTPPFSLFHGGAVVNVAVELNGQTPIQVYVRLRNTPEIAIRSIDLGVEEVIRTYEALRAYADVGSAFAIAKAALALAGFLPDFFPASCRDDARCRFTSLEDQLVRTFGGRGLELTLLVAIPAGSGLGTSSIVAGTALSALSEFCDLGWDTEDVCARVLHVEQLLTTGGGWQDQFGGLYAGVKLVQSSAGLVQRPTVCWLPERLFTAPGHAGCHVLYYTGLTRTAKSILSKIVRGVLLNERARLTVLGEMRSQVERLCTAISCGDMAAVGQLVAAAWGQNVRLDPGTCPPAVQAILERVKPYARGAKLVGAGGGGFLYIITKSEAAAQRLRDDLTANPPNARARFVAMRVSDVGIQVGRS